MGFLRVLLFPPPRRQNYMRWVNAPAVVLDQGTEVGFSPPTPNCGCPAAPGREDGSNAEDQLPRWDQ